MPKPSSSNREFELYEHNCIYVAKEFLVRLERVEHGTE